MEGAGGHGFHSVQSELSDRREALSLEEKSSRFSRPRVLALQATGLQTKPQRVFLTREDWTGLTLPYPQMIGMPYIRVTGLCSLASSESPVPEVILAPTQSKQGIEQLSGEE